MPAFTCPPPVERHAASFTCFKRGGYILWDNQVDTHTLRSVEPHGFSLTWGLKGSQKTIPLGETGNAERGHMYGRRIVAKPLLT